MFDLIVACDSNFGIGKNNTLPWHIPEELKIFREKTNDSILIMGRKTAETLPTLSGRIIAVLSRSNQPPKNNRNKWDLFSDLESALDWAKTVFPFKKIFIAGGAELYNYILTCRPRDIDTLHLSILKDSFDCDRFIHIDERWTIFEEENKEKFNHYILKYTASSELQYLNLIKNVLENGSIKNGRNGETKSIFFNNLSFDLDEGFPLLTTKKMFFKGIVEELLFFIKGETNSKLLEEKGVNIWKQNTNRAFLNSLNFKDRPEGMMGPMYGYQWRFFGAEYDEKSGKPKEASMTGIDQLKNVIETIKNDPSSRRILLTDFNPSQAHLGVLYPCHSIIIQFYVNENKLEMFCYNRSQDLFLGTPFNIASSALLLVIIAKLTGLKPAKLHMSLGDVHIYKDHYDLALLQTRRRCYKFPKIEIDDGVELDTLKVSNFKLTEYNFHPTIKANMIA